MKKIFFTIICSLIFMFIIWTIEIGIQNNWDYTNIRFDLKGTINLITNNTQSHFEEAWNNFSYTLKDSEIEFGALVERWQNVATNDNWFDAFEYIGGIFAFIGEGFVTLIRIFIGIIQIIIQLILIIADIIKFFVAPVYYKPTATIQEVTYILYMLGI